MAKAVRVGLGFWDRVVLLVAWVVTCGLVYLLGVYVGRGTGPRSAGLEDAVVRLPVTSKPPPAGERPKAESELTFYETLGAGEHGGARDVPAAAEPRPTPPPARTTTTSPPARAAVAPPRPAPRAAEAAPSRPAPAAPAAAASAGNAGWTVLASPTRNRAEAEDLARQLRARGYDAAPVPTERDGDTWYRVRVGRFASAEQATEVMRRLREREGVAHAFVASE